MTTSSVFNHPLLLEADPQPCALLSADAELLGGNRAFEQLLATQPLAAWLPVNYMPLVRAALQQHRAITEVEVQCAQRIMLWSFIPDSVQQQVLVRGLEATAQRQQLYHAARSQRLYRLITENTTDLISRHRPDGQFIDASAASWTLLGYWPEQLCRLALRRLLAPADHRLLPLCAEALAIEGYHTMTCRLRHGDGRWLWFEVAARAIRETYTGQVVEVVCISRDITARVQAEENRRRLAEVVEANTDLVFFIDGLGALSYLNPAARQALALADKAPLPALADIIEAGDLQRLQHEGRNAALQNGVWSAEATLRRYGEPPLLVSLVLLAHRSMAGERYFSLVARDMSERELREAERRRHLDELAHSERLISLGELASGIAHELNQPLAAVVNYASASQRYLASVHTRPQAAERVAQGLSRITEQAEHAAQVIKRLRSFLRKGQRRMQALSLPALLREAWLLCQWQAQQRQVQLDDALAANLPLVYADKVLLMQVLLNVLRNAMEANAEAWPQQASRIEVSAQVQAGHLCVRVRDYGPAVSEQVLEQLFIPFYTSKTDGLGLGLSMSRSIVEGFSGSLEAYPAAGQGLIMECRLPLARPLQE